MMHISDLQPDDTAAVAQAAALLVETFRQDAPQAWPDYASALDEVLEAVQPDKICRVARAADGTVLGWIGGIPQYHGHAWEMHPLLVRPAAQRQGIGRALVYDFEQQVRARGGHTIYLGTDDENGRTSLSGIDLFPDIWPHIAQIRNLGGHPFEFYQKCGYVIVGVIPDANGPGKPDIFMAKHVPPSPNS